MQVSARHLPHVYVVGQPLFVTFRLHGSLPAGRHFSRDSLSSAHVFDCWDRLLDYGTFGPLYLRMPGITEIVEHAIRQGERDDYTLHAWTIMPNHVHLLITPATNPTVIMRRLKGVTARDANRVLGRTGNPFWQHESFDRLVRNAQEFRSVERYIVFNPVRAGLAASPEQYRWSSAWKGELP